MNTTYLTTSPLSPRTSRPTPLHTTPHNTTPQHHPTSLTPPHSQLYQHTHSYRWNENTVSHCICGDSYCTLGSECRLELPESERCSRTERMAFFGSFYCWENRSRWRYVSSLSYLSFSLFLSLLPYHFFCAHLFLEDPLEAFGGIQSLSPTRNASAKFISELVEGGLVGWERLKQDSNGYHTLSSLLICLSFLLPSLLS